MPNRQFCPAAYCLGARLACGAIAALGVHAAALGATSELQPADSASFTAVELEELVGPIALYPDTLLANVLAASVYPEDVARAASFVAGGGTDIDGQEWDEPVKAVAKVPDAIAMMGEFPDWVAALGQAYLNQGAEVMAAVQNLRLVASENGALADSEHQTVEESGDTIVIVSSEPEVVYVPTYEPAVVYAPYQPGAALATGVLAFGVGVAVGAAWDNLDCDWHGGCVGWGWGDNDVNIDIDREINTGDINIGSGNTNIQGGNRVRTGQEGNAWTPNQQRASSQARPNAAQQYRTQASRGGSASPSRGWSGRGTSAGTRPSGGNRAARPPAQRSMPATPPRATSGAGRDGAFQGGSGTRASSDRGHQSRSAGGGGGGGRSRPSGGGGRGGGGGGGRRR